MKRVAIYLRVSTSKQDTENQLRELSAVADRSGWEIWKVYEDAGISGAKGRDFFVSPDAKTDLRRADELASLAIKIDPDYHTAHAAKGDALLAAGRYRDAIDSYERALILAPSTILVGLPLAYDFIGEPEQAIAYADKAMQLSPFIYARVGPVFYLAKAIAFGILQDYEQALVWIERAEAAAPEIVFMGFFRSVLLAMAGKEDEARAAMQRYLANDNAPVRTMSQWRARFEGVPLPSYNPLVLARLLTFRKKFDDGLRKAGLPE
jgi:tetratricopeptide (TPR) repeat protein